jgi:hypothetical protein
MIIQAGDLGVAVDTGSNTPGVLQRLVADRWIDYRVNGQPVQWPVRLEQLEPGRYRLKENPGRG